MRISAVIPTKNRVSDLVNAFKSILNQSRLPDEILVIDQSVDAFGKSKIEEMVAFSQPGFSLKYIYDPKIMGLVDAKRVAVENASGDVICFLEDDVVLEPNYIRSMEAAFEREVTMMGCCGVVTNLPTLPSNYLAFFHLFHKGIFHDPRVGVHGYSHLSESTMIQSHYLSGGTSAYRKEVFNKVPFDLENGFFMLEDIDFSTRAAKEFGEEKFYINTGARLAHMMSPVNRASLAPRYRRKLREYICFYKKNRDEKYALFSLIWLIIGLIFESIFASIRLRNIGPLEGTFRGVSDGVKWRMIATGKISA